MKKLSWLFPCSMVVLALAFSGCQPKTAGTGVPLEERGGETDLPPSKENPEGNIPEGKRPDWSGRKPDMAKWQPIHFDYDSAAIRSEDRGTLQEIAAHLKANPGDGVVIIGHCDERGTAEYNRVLGQRRASAAREYLVKLGAGVDSISTVSEGADRPVDPGHDEAAWAKNRRDEFGLVH